MRFNHDDIAALTAVISIMAIPVVTGACLYGGEVIRAVQSLMWPFKKKSPKPPRPSCAKCGDEFIENYYSEYARCTWKGWEGYCWHCAQAIDAKNVADRKRQEELAALVVVRLASQNTGYRGEQLDSRVVAAEAMRLAKAIMEAK